MYTSSLVERELSDGLYAAQRKALPMAKRLTYLFVDKRVRIFAQRYVDEGIVPETHVDDAVHLAITTVHEVDYLLTWNHTHLVNFYVQERLGALNRKLKLRSPGLVSPDTIPKAALGQELRRLDRE
jgi:hypothetical protein